MNADSVKARLKNFAVENGHTFQEALTYYALERTVYRISISRYSEQFVLKGGIFLYAIFNCNYVRATTDVDLLAKRITNSGPEIKTVFQEIFTQSVDDALVYDLDSVKVEDITEFKEYHGLHVSAVAYLDRTRIPIGIDIGYGDIIYPHAVKMDFPVILDMKPPKIMAYSLESSVAEKIEAIIENGYLNSRYKDFYDIYVLSREKAFSYFLLREAVMETFLNRKTPLTMDSAAFSEEFINDPIHQTRWDAFQKKKKTMIQAPLKDVLNRIKEFAYPLVVGKEDENMTWDPKEGRWK